MNVTVRTLQKILRNPEVHFTKTALKDQLDIMEDEIMTLAKRAWAEYLNGCAVCKGASAAYMEVLGEKET